MSTERLECGESWRHYHPDWTFVIWTLHNLPPMINHDQFHDSQNVGQKSDILRYEVLHAYGGLYVDTDFECLRSIEPLVKDFDCFAAEEEPGRLGNALIGCTSGHFLMRRVLRRLPNSILRYAGQWPPAQTGPRLFTACVRESRGWNSGIKVFPTDLFYPLDAPGSKKQRKSLAGAYAVHHGHGGWHGQKCDNLPRREKNRT